jgi:adenosine deaminase
LTQPDAVEAVIAGMNAAERGNGIETGLILCAMSFGDASKNQAENIETVDVAKQYLGRGVNAIDLAGAEALCPISDFAYVFKKARELNIPFTCHAGDSGGVLSVRTAVLEFGAKRIGHGHMLIEDKELCDIVRSTGVTLEICLTSNIHCTTQPSYELHPAKKLLDMGINVTLNTDNPCISGVTIDSEYDVALKYAGFCYDDLVKMSKNAVNAAFISEQDKQRLLSH